MLHDTKTRYFEKGLKAAKKNLQKSFLQVFLIYTTLFPYPRHQKNDTPDKDKNL